LSVLSSATQFTDAPVQSFPSCDGTCTSHSQARLSCIRCLRGFGHTLTLRGLQRICKDKRFQTTSLTFATIDSVLASGPSLHSYLATVSHVLPCLPRIVGTLTPQPSTPFLKAVCPFTLIPHLFFHVLHCVSRIDLTPFLISSLMSGPLPGLHFYFLPAFLLYLRADGSWDKGRLPYGRERVVSHEVAAVLGSRLSSKRGRKKQRTRAREREIERE